MRKKVLLFLLTVVIFFSGVSHGFCLEIKLVKKIIIEKDALLLSGYFVVMEDGNFIFTDIKEENGQIKIINKEGKVIKAWGKRGPGPDEFGGLAKIDYQKPYVAIKDAGKKCVHIFKVDHNYNFKKITDILAWEATGFIKLYKKRILLGGYIVSPQEKPYIIFARDFQEHNTEYILPLEFTYGGRSLREHRKIRDKVEGVSHGRYAALSGDTLFYVSDVRLKVIKIDLKTKKIDILGKEPKNFRALVMNEKTKKELLRPQAGKKVMEEILNKFSFVSGIFADRNIFGVIYTNRDKKVEDELYFRPYIQIYNHSGELIYEGQLEEFYSEENLIPLFYQPASDYLYMLSIITKGTSLVYTIYKYQIEQ